MGVRDKSPTPINSLLILFPFTATIGIQQGFSVITKVFNIVSCQEREKRRGEERRGRSIRELTNLLRNHSAIFKYCVLQRKGGGEIGEISYRNLVY